MQNTTFVKIGFVVTLTAIVGLAMTSTTLAAPDAAKSAQAQATAIISGITNQRRIMLPLIMNSKSFADTLKASPEIQHMDVSTAKMVLANIGKYVKVSPFGGNKSGLISIEVKNIPNARDATKIATEVANEIILQQEKDERTKLELHYSALQDEKERNEKKLLKLFSLKNDLIKEQPKACSSTGPDSMTMRMEVLVEILVESDIAAGVLKKETTILKRMMVARANEDTGLLAAKLAKVVAEMDKHLLRGQLARKQLAILEETGKELAKVRLEYDSILREEESLNRLIEQIDSDILDIRVQLSSKVTAKLHGVFINQ